MRLPRKDSLFSQTRSPGSADCTTTIECEWYILHSKRCGDKSWARVSTEVPERYKWPSTGRLSKMWALYRDFPSGWLKKAGVDSTIREWCLITTGRLLDSSTYQEARRLSGELHSFPVVRAWVLHPDGAQFEPRRTREAVTSTNVLWTTAN